MYVSSSFRVYILAFLAAVTVGAVGCRNHKQVGTGGNNTASEKKTVSPGEIELASGESTSGSGEASGYEGTEVASLDVAGIRLGMTPEQVIAALKSFDSGLYYSKRYTSSQGQTNYGAGGPTSCAEGPNRLFVGIKAAKGTTFLGEVDMPQLIRCGAEDYDKLPGDEPELISVYFNPDPGNHRVIAVSLQEKFKTPRAISSVIDSIQAKYPKDITASLDGSGGRYRYWKYDSRMRLMSKAAAEREWATPMGGAFSSIGSMSGNNLPSWVNERNTVALDAGVVSSSENHELTSEFGIVLYDAGALVRFNQKSEAYFAKVKADQAQQEVDHARQSSSPVKF
jgi:hypothetical protein